MTALLAALLIGTPLLNVPAWLVARRNHGAVWWLPLIGVPAILVWVGLVALGVGPQSLANVVELMALGALSVLFCYAQAFLLDRRFTDTRQTTNVLLGSLVGVAVALRVLMPNLPE